MKAFQLSAYQAQPVLEDAPSPKANANEVIVRVAVAALNPLDTKIQQGFMHDFFPVAFPYTLGTDLAGTIEEVGPDVEGWAVGDRVVARTDPSRGGAVGELAAMPASQLVRLPASVAMGDAAGLATAAATAYQALFEVAGLRSGQTILIHAGAGGVGSFAIQLARHAGARVIATASGDGIDIVRRLGADQVIDYKAEAFEEMVSDADVVLDTIGGDTQQRSFGVLRKGGYLAATASPPDDALATAHGVVASFVFHQSDAERLGKLVAMLDTRSLKVLIDRMVGLEDVGNAFAYQASGRARGKILVSMGGK